MTLRIAINGFGRIGRNILRAQIEAPRDGIDIVAINDLAPAELSAHLLKYDSVHGPIKQDVSAEPSCITVGDKSYHYTSQPDPTQQDYKGLGVDLVLESTGRFTDGPSASAHLEAGARRVIISAPAKSVDRTVVFGVNHTTITADDKIISNASCTTNCLAPLAAVLAKSCGIEQGFMTTIHSYTSDQQLLDSEHKDLYRARAAALNMIPTTTGAARAIGLVLPKLDGRLDGVAVRVPTPNVSAVDLVFQPERIMDAEALNAAMIEASEGPLKGVLDVTDKPLVSSDMNHNPASSVLHLDQTRCMEGGMTRLFSWYDNEWGFSNRMLDVSAYLAH